MPKASFYIHPARSASDLASVARLFEAYASSLDVDLSFQDFAAELAALPGKYAPPAGELRPMELDGCCEMKRLYVAPSGRGLGLGRALVDAIVAEAVRIGYREMRLDTLPSMIEAIALYRKAGFVPIEPYYQTPIAGTLFLARPLVNG